MAVAGELHRVWHWGKGVSRKAKGSASIKLSSLNQEIFIILRLHPIAQTSPEFPSFSSTNFPTPPSSMNRPRWHFTVIPNEFPCSLFRLFFPSSRTNPLLQSLLWRLVSWAERHQPIPLIPCTTWEGFNETSLGIGRSVSRLNTKKNLDP